MILINVSKAIKYLPMSRNTNKNRQRYDILYDIAVSNNTNIDKIEIDFAIYLANILKLRVEHAIKTQKINGIPMSAIFTKKGVNTITELSSKNDKAGTSMSKIYQKLSDSYNKSKNPINKDKFWTNTGELVKKLKVWKSSKGVNVGFPPNARHTKSQYSKSRAKLDDIVKWMEYGTKKMPARPLFTAVVSHISKNIDVYFVHFIQLKGYKING